MRLWLDVEDLFEYARTNYRRPSGIQRLAFEIYRELQARYGATGQVCFVCHSLTGNSFQAVPWSEVAALFAALANSDATPTSSPQKGHREGPGPGPVFPHLPSRRLIRRLAYRLSPSLRADVIDAVLSQARAVRACGRVAATLARGAARIVRTLVRQSDRPKADDPPVAPASDSSFADLAAPGDILLMLAAAWSHPNYADLIRRQCKANGLRFALLVYDLVPLRHPEWCDRVVAISFRNWIDGVLRLSDNVFAISHATTADTEAYASEQEIALPGPIVTLPIGSTKWHTVERHSAGLPPPGSYALVVSTIEARKNHLLLFRVWQRLLRELPRDRVPTLVFAGRVGWLVDDLMQQIANTEGLGGKLLHIDSPSDSALAALYDGCLFTLFPSFFEGWGLPVTESLAFGKPCIISNRTSLPEAGGKLARSFDPDNLHDAYAVIRKAIEDPAALARWQAQVQHEFRPVPWSATVDALLDGLGYPWAAASTTADVRPASYATAANRAPATAK
jgi:glycosyltransferase involved in cell wall biosynthesis